jgi:hypothetical protein
MIKRALESAVAPGWRPLAEGQQEESSVDPCFGFSYGLVLVRIVHVPDTQDRQVGRFGVNRYVPVRTRTGDLEIIAAINESKATSGNRLARVKSQHGNILLVASSVARVIFKIGFKPDEVRFPVNDWQIGRREGQVSRSDSLLNSLLWPKADFARSVR